MSNATKAADDIKSLAARFHSVLEVADVLEKIGNLDQAVRDAENRKNVAIKESERAVGDASEKKKILAGILSDIESAKGAVDQQQKNARAQANEIIDDARAKSVEIVKGAEQMRSNSSAHVRAETSKVDALKRDIAQLEGVLAGIKTHIQEAKRKITEI